MKKKSRITLEVLRPDGSVQKLRVSLEDKLRFTASKDLVATISVGEVLDDFISMVQEEVEEEKTNETVEH